MVAKLVSCLPVEWIRRLGRLQFILPVCGPFIGGFARRYIATEGTIKNGIGAGLRFDARGGFPGYLLGTTEPEEQAMLADSLAASQVFYDIGANVGFYSTLAARLVGTAGQVYAFEPDTISAAKVRRNAALNGFTNVRVIEAAISDTSGFAFFARGESSATSRIIESSEQGDERIPTITIDSLCDSNEIRPPNLIMIDVEGAEIKVLMGMVSTIRKYRPTIMCEVHWLNDAFSKFYEEELRPLGYSVTTYSGAQLPLEIQRFHAVLKPSSTNLSQTD